MANLREQRRIASLLPNGKPKWVRIYDNGGRSADRYTCIFTGRYTHKTDRQHLGIGMSENPYHPQGVGIHFEDSQQPDTRYPKRQYGWPPAIGRSHPFLGKRITFDDLPEKCQQLVMQDYLYIWGLPGARE